MIYAIYDDKGQIVKSIDCPPEHIERHVKAGQGYLQTAAHDGTHYVENGKLIAMPAKPSNKHVFDYDSKEWVEIKPQTTEDVLQKIREQRNMLLLQSDWTQLPDSPLSDSKKQEWRDYRQALRDFPESGSNEWPEPPM